MSDEVKEILEDLQMFIQEKYLLEDVLNEKKAKLLYDYITNLQEENERLEELNVCVGCENSPDYKSRCEKADKFIMSKHNWYGDEEEDNEEYLFELEDFEELLNILNGGDE